MGYDRLNPMQLMRLAREAHRRGRCYEILKSVKNQYGEPARDENGKYILEDKGWIRGIYHTSNSYVSQTVGDVGIGKTKQTPMILTPYYFGHEIEAGDIVLADDGTYYTVTDINDISEMMVAFEISLEVKEGAEYVVPDGLQRAGVRP